MTAPAAPITPMPIPSPEAMWAPPSPLTKVVVPGPEAGQIYDTGLSPEEIAVWRAQGVDVIPSIMPEIIPVPRDTVTETAANLLKDAARTSTKPPVRKARSSRRTSIQRSPDAANNPTTQTEVSARHGGREKRRALMPGNKADIIVPEDTEMYTEAPLPSFFDYKQGKRVDKGSGNRLSRKERMIDELYGRAYNIMDAFGKFEPTDSALNVEAQKAIQEWKGMGPDSLLRAAFYKFNPENGRFYNYKGEAVDISAAVVRKSIRRLIENPAVFQEVADYEISKREEQWIDSGWDDVLEFMVRETNWSVAEFKSRMNGLVYRNKGSYLAKKNTNIELDYMREWNPTTNSYDHFTVPPDADTPKKDIVMVDGKEAVFVRDPKKLVFGAVKPRALANELATKFPTYQYSFRVADVASFLSIVADASDFAVRYARKYGNGGALMPVPDKHDPNYEDAKFEMQAYLDSLYVLNRFNLVVQAARYGGAGRDPSEENMAQIAQQQQQYANALAKAGQNAANAPVQPNGRRVVRPFISPNIGGGGAEAKKTWDQIATITDEMVSVFPILDSYSIDDFYENAYNNNTNFRRNSGLGTGK